MSKNVLTVISVIAFIAGMGIGAWGLIKEECNNTPDCYVGSGFLLWTGGILIVGGLYGMYKFTWGVKK